MNINLILLVLISPYIQDIKKNTDYMRLINFLISLLRTGERNVNKKNNNELPSHVIFIGDTKLFHSSIYCDSSHDINL